MPGTKKLSRLKENLGAVGIEFTPDDLKEIDTALTKIKLAGSRLPDATLAMTGR